MTTNEIIESIVDGHHDQDMAHITAAMKQRKEAIEAKRRLSFRPGDTVRFTQTARPQYIRGLTATIVKINAKRVIVQFPDDASAGRYRGAQGVSCPVGILEAVAP